MPKTLSKTRFTQLLTAVENGETNIPIGDVASCSPEQLAKLAEAGQAKNQPKADYRVIQVGGADSDKFGIVLGTTVGGEFKQVGTTLVLSPKFFGEIKEAVSLLEVAHTDNLRSKLGCHTCLGIGAKGAKHSCGK